MGEGDSGRFGASTAIALKTGKPVWREELRAPPTSAQLATAGGIVFDGSADRVRACRSTAGEALWRTSLGAIPTSFPITFTVESKQYAAVVAGEGTYHDGVATMLASRLTPRWRNPLSGRSRCPNRHAMREQIHGALSAAVEWRKR
ncbi:MAG: hypothetical protein H6905_04490 [Hyphomicrobiales bacterium]|nr:hypothetical protein [Hyphomicrobiales bacterium]